MKKILFLLTVLFSLALGAGAQNVAINSTGATANASAMLDVSASNAGILIPRVALTGSTIAAPVTSPATSLLVYNTATVSDVTPGYYYWSGTAWIRLYSGAVNCWNLTGNSGTAPATNFIGTIDAQDWVIRTTNTERARVLAGGNILFNRTTALYATDLFEAQGNTTFPDAINGYTDQLDGIGVAGVNTTATGAGFGTGVYGQSYQTGAAGVWGTGSTYTRGVLGTTNNATYAGTQGQNSNIDGDGVYAVNSATTGAGVGTGIYGVSYQTGAAGVWGTGSTYTRGVLASNDNATYAAAHAQNVNAGGDALYAVNSAANGNGLGSAVYAVSGQTGGASIMSMMQSTSFYANSAISAYNGTTYETTIPKGVIAGVSSDDGIAVYGVNTAALGTATGNGVYGATAQSVGIGVEGYNSHTSGTGMFGIGNATTGSYLTSGSGAAFTGTTAGSYSKATSATGTAVLGAGNNLGVYTLTSGSGCAFTGSTVGVYGTTELAADAFGGYFDNANGSYSYVGGTFSGTNYKINGNGSVSTIVSRPDNTKANMFAPEAPEILFQDYGTGKLVNGQAHIELDPVLVNNIYVDSDHPLKVFVQLEGNCNGVYVANKTKNGFDVVELNNGQSNVEFSWTVVANRADVINENGSISSKHVGVRFPNAPLIKEKKKETTNTRGPVSLPEIITNDNTKNVVPEITKAIKGTVDEHIK